MKGYLTISICTHQKFIFQTLTNQPVFYGWTFPKIMLVVRRLLQFIQSHLSFNSLKN